MTRLRIFLPLLILAALFAGGCADGNSDAPGVDEAHPPGWIFAHDEVARDRLNDCRTCHGLNFQGAGEAVSCFLCHPAGPPDFANFLIHPAAWGQTPAAVVANHQGFPLQLSWTTCSNAACHGEDLRGGTSGPSCFAAQYTASDGSVFTCHTSGPPAPHPTGLFFLPQNHGPLAQNSQLFCRNCHGRPPFFFDGGYVADPAIVNQPVGNCSLFFCHPAADAHPTNWQGSNDPDPATYLASHRDISRAAIEPSCALCHDVDNVGASPRPAAPGCFAGGFTNADGSTTICHPGGP